ncbi:hypothetical protein Tco_0685889 [Tanacetum coccineum]
MEKMLLAQVQEARIALSKDQLAILADIGERVNFGLGAYKVTTNAIFQSDGIDLYDSDCDDVPTGQASFMDNFSSYGSNAAVQDTNSSTQQDSMILSVVEQMTDHVANLDKENQTNKMQCICSRNHKFFYDDTHKQALGYQNPFHLKKAQRIKPTLYDGSVIAKEHAVISMIDDEETLILEEESRSKMLDKQNDPISIEKKIKISPIDYSKLNKIKEDFGKRFVTQKELSAEQAFWLKHSSFSETPVTSHTPVRIEAPSELPKVSLVNESLKKLKYHLASFDKVVKKRTTSDAITAGAWGFEHTKACFVTEIIPFLKVLKDTFNAFDKTLLDEITEVQTVFNQMEAAVDQCSVDKNTFEIEKKELKLENERLLEHIICQDVVNIVMHADVKFDNVLPVPNTFLDDNIALDVMKMENDRLMELLVSQDLVHTAVNSLAVINDYRNEYVSKSKVIAPVVHKLDLEPLSSKLKNKREAHVDYIRITKENADTLCDIVEQARISNPLDNVLAYACMYTKQIQELLIYVSDTCPNSSLKSEKLVAVTPMNKARKVTFAKNKAHTRNAKPSLNKENSLPKSVCSTCKKFLFDANHDLCVVNYLSDVNARARAKSVKSIKKKEWEPTGPAPHRKEKCTLQFTLSLKQEKSSYLRAVLSTTSISSHARSATRLGLHQLTPGYISSQHLMFQPSKKKTMRSCFNYLFVSTSNRLPRAISPDPVVVAALKSC